MNPLALPAVSRHAFYSGQVLGARDLDDAVTVERALRWLHNRTLHEWGVALGYMVDGRKGARTVRVHPGYALDIVGRDVVLEQDAEVAVPPVSAGPDGKPAPYLLTVSYTDDADAVVELREGACGANGAVRRDDAPSVQWLRPAAVRAGLDIVLASGHVAGCALVAPVDQAVRRSARREEGPMIAAGTTPVGATVWRPWPGVDECLGLTTTVSTVSACFAEPPRYMVRVGGGRFVSEDDSPTGEPFVLDGHAAVVLDSPSGFDVIVPLPASFTTRGVGGAVPCNPTDVVSDPTTLVELAGGLGWHVVWMGIEGP